MSDELKDAIEENAMEPASADIDGVRVTQHGIREQIEAHKYLAGMRAASRGRTGLRLAKVIPPGAV